MRKKSANKLCPLSQSRKAIQRLKERRRNEPLEVRNQRLARVRYRTAMNRAMEASPERRARLAASRFRSARNRKLEDGLEKREMYLYERLRQQVAISKLSLNLSQQLDENFIEEEPTDNVESNEEKQQRRQRNTLRRQLQSNLKRQEAKRMRLEKSRINTARRRFEKPQEERVQSPESVGSEPLYLYTNYDIEVEITSELLLKAERDDESI